MLLCASATPKCSRSVPADVFRMFIRPLFVSWLDYCNAALAGVPINFLHRFQSVMNIVARTVADLYTAFSLSLAGLHWLREPERITFKLVLLAYRCLHGTAPSYLASQLHRFADMSCRRQLRSSATQLLFIRPTRLATDVDDRAFPVAAARVWSGLPIDIHCVCLWVYLMTSQPQHQ